MRYLKPVTSLVCLSYLLSEMRLVRATTSAKLSDSTDSYQNVPRNTHRADPEATPGFLLMFPSAFICANGSCPAHDQEMGHYTIIWHNNRVMGVQRTWWRSALYKWWKYQKWNSCFFLPDQESCPFFQTGLSGSVLQKMTLLNCTFPKVWEIRATPTVSKWHNNPGTTKK